MSDYCDRCGSTGGGSGVAEHLITAGESVVGGGCGQLGQVSV